MTQSGSKFFLRRNTRMALVQLASQRELIKTYDVNQFVLDKGAWGWGHFDIQLFHELFKNVDQGWDISERYAVSMLSANWNWERMNLELRAILRCAISELIYTDIHINIAIKEYLGITRAFYNTDDEISFIRSILDRFNKDLLISAKQQVSLTFVQPVIELQGSN